jgi:hypothetical protein
LAQLTTFEHMPNFMDIHDTVFHGLFRSGLPGIVLVITFAQLTPSLLAKEYPLRFLQIPGVYSTIYVALLLENCGIVHFTYVLYSILNKAFFSSTLTSTALLPAGTRKSDEISDASSSSSNNDHVHLPVGLKPPPGGSLAPHSKEVKLAAAAGVADYKEEDEEDIESACEAAAEKVTETARFIDKVLLYVRYFLSTVLTVLCIVFVFGCIAKRHSMIKATVGGQFVVFFLALVIITYCEGMKVAVVCTTHLDSEKLKDFPTAYKIHKLLNVGEC